MDNTAQLLFNYLKDVLYNPGRASLDLDALPEDFRTLGEGLQYIGKCILETKDFSAALAKGRLGVPLPSPDNELAAPLKSLHAALKHMTWQSQQVAKGDYSQHVEFMGEFSEAFNTMIQQLDQRQSALQAEIESGRKKTRALEKSNSLFEAITENMPQWIVVVDRATKERLFVNRAAREVLEGEPVFAGALWEWLAGYAQSVGGTDEPQTDEVQTIEIDILPEEYLGRSLSVTLSPLAWRRREAVAYVLADVSAEKQQRQKLEQFAYNDTLTGLHNRFYGMRVLRQWDEERRTFSLCFIDLDNLKYVNDSYGHAEGDRYITTAANWLRETAADAVVARLGGDEFMVLVPDIPQAAMVARMEEIRQAFLEEGGSYHRSISYGVVEVTPGNTLTVSELLALADDRMYKYKREQKARRLAQAAE